MNQIHRQSGDRRTSFDPKMHFKNVLVEVRAAVSQREGCGLNSGVYMSLYEFHVTCSPAFSHRPTTFMRVEVGVGNWL